MPFIAYFKTYFGLKLTKNGGFTYNGRTDGTLFKKYDNKEAVFKVKYNLPVHKWGRINPEKSLSLCVFHEIQKWVDRKQFGISHVAFTKELKKYCQVNHFDNVETIVKKLNGKNKRVWKGLRVFVFNPEEEHEEVELVEE